MRLSKHTGIALGLQYKNPHIGEIIRYAGGAVFTQKGEVILNRTRDESISVWVDHNCQRVRSFGIEPTLVDLREVGK